MTMAMSNECFLELEVEEQLFAAVVHWPFEEFEKLVLKLPNVDVKNASGRSLLHIAVRLGKSDWVEGLLACGADPSMVDNRGFTALEVAKDMVERCPDDDDLNMILRLVRVSSRGGCKVQQRVETHAEKRSAMNGDLKTDVDHKEGRQDSGLAEVLSSVSRISQDMASLLDSVDQLRNETVIQVGDVCKRLVSSAVKTAIQMGNLCQQQLSTSEEIASLRETIQSLATSVTSLKGTTQTSRGDVVLLINELSQHMASSGIKISFVKENFDSLSADMRESLTNLQSGVTSLTGEVTSVGSVLGEVKSHVDSLVTTRESDTSVQLNSLKKAMEGFGRNLRSRDILLEALETSITSLAERLAPAWEGNNRAATEPQGAVKTVEASKEEVKSVDNGCGPTTSRLVWNSSHVVVSSAASRPENVAPNQTWMPRGAVETGIEIEEDNDVHVTDGDGHVTDGDGHVTDYDEEYETGSEEMVDSGEALTGTASGIGTLIRQTSEETYCVQCVEAMMEKTNLYNDYNGEVERVRSFYTTLYQTSPMTSCVLSFLARHPLTRVSVDLESSKIANMKERFLDHDGTAFSNGAFINSGADFDERRVYLGGLVERSEASMLAHFMKSLTQLALFLAFNNNGLPYFQCDLPMENKVHRILTQVRRKKYMDRAHLDWYLHRAVVARNYIGAEMLLMAAVPAIMVKYGSEPGTALLREELPSLLSFYEESIMPLINRAATTL